VCVRVLDVAGVPGRAVGRFGSQFFDVAEVAGEGHVTVVRVRLGPGGVIGRHPAAGRQLLVVIVGEASVTGGDGRVETVRPGQAVLWDSGEQHETRSAEGLLALVVEGDLVL
jgi:quercetin dioxygenase-like cupin family protein